MPDLASRKHLGTDDGGLAEYVHFDSKGDPVGVQYVQDVQSVVDWCHEARDFPAGKEWRHVGRYPVGELMVFGKLNGVDDPCWYLKREYDHLMRKLINDSDHALLRVSNGRV